MNNFSVTSSYLHMILSFNSFKFSRLSEALARLHMKDVVLSSHVADAALLLDKSVIRVEMPDVNLMEDFEVPIPENNETEVYNLIQCKFYLETYFK